MTQSATRYLNQNKPPSFPGTAINQNKLRVATSGNIFYFNIKDIIRIQSISNYSKLFLVSGKTLIVSKVLAHFDALLTSHDFSRVHRTHLVNMHYLKQFMQGNMLCIGMNSEMVPVSRRRKKTLKQRMMALAFKEGEQADVVSYN